MEMLACECGSELFETIQPKKFTAHGFRIWHIKEVPKHESITVTVGRCLSCDRLLVPATSLAGKNALDPEVQAYGELLKIVKGHNDIVEFVEFVRNTYGTNMVRIYERLDEIQDIIRKEVLNVEATEPDTEVSGDTPRRARGKVGAGSGKDSK